MSAALEVTQTRDAPVGGARHLAGPVVRSHDEFTTLQEVIIGSAVGARLPRLSDRSAWLNLYPDLPASQLACLEAGPFAQRVIEETEEDLAALAAVLAAEGVTVRRADALDSGAEFGGPGWRSDGFSSYCPRDSALVIGETIIETASPMRARYFEAFALRRLFQSYMRRGAGWISAPRPQLGDNLYRLNDQGLPALGEAEPVFEAANVLRCGTDLLYQVSGSGNELGGQWLAKTVATLGPYRVHPLRGIYDHTHIDSTIAILRPGLVLLNPERVGHHNLPALFHNWDIIWCPPMNPGQADGPHLLSSPWIGMNLLMVRPDLAVVDADQQELITALEHHGIDVQPLRLRHARTLGGGFHCVTLDIRREGELADYAN